MKYHDIIVGDFGRQGTLRYFNEFSSAEKRLIQARIGDAPFFDEYRIVDYTIAGLLHKIKKDLLERLYRESPRLDDRVLFGSINGSEAVSYARQFAEQILPYIQRASAEGAEAIRVVIPCNTLAPVADYLEGYFNEIELEKKLPVSVPNIPAVVMKKIDAGQVYLIATKAAFSAYENLVRKQGLDVALSGGTPEQLEQSERILLCSIRGEDPSPYLRDIGTAIPVISACTDVCIPGTIDSLCLFAQHMAEEVYLI